MNKSSYLCSLCNNSRRSLRTKHCLRWDWTAPAEGGKGNNIAAAMPNNLSSYSSATSVMRKAEILCHSPVKFAALWGQDFYFLQHLIALHITIFPQTIACGWWKSIISSIFWMFLGTFEVCIGLNLWRNLYLCIFFALNCYLCQWVSGSWF